MKNTLKALFIGLGFVGLTAFMVRSQEKKGFDPVKFKQAMQDSVKSGKFAFAMKAGAIMRPYMKSFKIRNYEVLNQFRKTYNPELHRQKLENIVIAFWQEYGQQIKEKLTQKYKEIVGEDMPQKEIDSFKEEFKKGIMLGQESEFKESTKIYQGYLKLKK